MFITDTDPKKKDFIQVVTNEVAAGKDLDKVLDGYGVSKADFFEWLNKFNKVKEFEKETWIATTDIGVSFFNTDNTNLDIAYSDLRAISEAMYHIKEGSTKDAACKKAGINPSTFMWYIGKFSALSQLYDHATSIRVVNLRDKRYEEGLQDLKDADEARRGMLKKRNKKTVTRKQGTIVSGNRTLPVDNSTVKVEELEPDLGAVKLTYELVGLLGKDEKSIDVNVNVLAEFSKDEASKVQLDSTSRIEELKKRRAGLAVEDADVVDE